jgi:hypothetical protein
MRVKHGLHGSIVEPDPRRDRGRAGCARVRRDLHVNYPRSGEQRPQRSDASTYVRRPGDSSRVAACDQDVIESAEQHAHVRLGVGLAIRCGPPPILDRALHLRDLEPAEAAMSFNEIPATREPYLKRVDIAI